jgi:soluble lytic murein transglycosylase-like protein
LGVFIFVEIYLPPSLLRTIGEVESGLNPYALNIGGKSYFPGSVEEALKLIEGKKSFDIGIMQINKKWFDRYNYSYRSGFDPCWNITMGAYILAYEVARHGYNRETAGRYHSPNSVNKYKYMFRIAKKLKK